MSAEAEDIDQTVGALRNLGNLMNPSLRTRLAVLNHIETFLASNEFPETKPGPLKKLFRAVTVAYLESFDEQPWINALSMVFTTASKLTLPFDLCECVLGVISEQQNNPHRFGLPLSAARLVELCCLILSVYTTESTVTDAWVKSLLNLIGERSEVIWQVGVEATLSCPSRARAQHKVNHYVGNMLRAQPLLLPHCLSVWFPSPQPTKASSSLCGVLLAYTQQRQPVQYPSTKALILEVYQQRLLSVTKPQSIALASSAWSPLLSTISAQDWTGSTDPTAADATEGFESLLIKVMKKAPESGSFVTKAIIDKLPVGVDTSAFVHQVGAVAVIKMLKSGDAVVRAAGMGLAKALSVKCADPGAQQLLVTQLLEGYLGKGTVGAGGLMSSQGVQKRCVLYALSQSGENVTRAVGGAAAVSIAVGVVASLQSLLDKEIDASIRLQAAHTLGVWLRPCLHSSTSTAATTEEAAKITALLTVAKTHLDKPVAANNPLGACYLLALAVAVNSDRCETDADLSKLESFVANGVLAILKEAVKKPSSGAAAPPSVEVVLAFHIAVRLQRLSTVVQATFESAKLWSLLSSASSVLYSPSLVTLLTTSPLSSTCTGISGVSRSSAVTVQAVADGSVDNLGGTLFCAEAVKCWVGLIEIAVAENPAVVADTLTASSPASLQGEVGLPVRALASLLVLPADHAVRETVCAQMNRIVSAHLTGDRLAVPVLKALWSQLSALAAQRQRYNTQRVANFKATEEGPDTPTSSSAQSTSKAPSIPAPARWQAALLACVPSAERVTASSTVRAEVRAGALLPHMAIVAAHPFVSGSSKKAAQVWQHVCANVLALFGLSSTIDQEEEEEGTAAADKLAASMEAVTITEAELSSSQIIPQLLAILTETAVSTVGADRQAAHNFLYLLSDPSQLLYADKRSIDCVIPQFDASLMNEHVLPSLLPLLDTTAVDALSSADLRAYANPTAAIASIITQLQQESDAARAAEAIVTNADRKKTAPRSARRGNFGADSAVIEDEDWAERVRAEKALALQKARSEGGVEYEEVKQRVLAQQAAAALVVDRVLHALSMWEALTSVNVSTARLGMVMLLDTGRLSALLRSTVVGDAAHSMLLKLAEHVVELDCTSYTRDICDSLRLIEQSVPSYTVANTFASEEEGVDAYRVLYDHSGPLLRLLQSLLMLLSRAAAEHRGSGAKPLPVTPCTFLMLYPILRGVLLLPHVMPGTEHTFHLLDSLWPSVEVFTAKMMSPLFVPGIAALRSVQRSLLDVTLRVLGRPHRTDPPADRVFFRVCTQLPNTPAWSCLLPAEWEPLMSEVGILSPELKVRLSVIQVAQFLFRERLVLVLKLSPALECLLWMLKFDESEPVATVAAELWSGRESGLTADYFEHLKPLLSHTFPHVRSSAARALAGALSVAHAHSAVLDVLKALQEMFTSSLPVRRETSSRAPTPSTSGKGGKGASALAILSAPAARKDASDDKHFAVRVAVAQVFAAIGTQATLAAELAVGSHVVTDLLEFILQSGMVDSHAEVRSAMLTAGRALIDNLGKDQCAELMKLLESVIAAKFTGDSKDEEALAAFDNRNAAAVVLLGATGRHLQKDDPAVGAITKSLITALKTPSESVQRAVADCLTPLVQSLKGTEVADTLLESLVLMTLEGATYGERKGAAFGLSAFVKGLGIPCLKQHDIIPRLKEACASGSINSRQGALFAFQCLSERIGLLFEPYIISIVEVLLKSFSHSSDHVREAATEAARVIMNKLSAHGVKQVLTPILASLPNETAWKSRQESIRLLGMMAHCAPKQLASCLPQVVPALMLAGSDPHPKVKDSAKAALHDISSVIRNPEVLRLSPVLLGAIGDPANKTRDALEALLECEFMHSIDAPSLALLVPILARALRDRGADLKRKSAAITGNMVSMVSDAKILSPYLVQVLPGLQDCLLDPIPDVRATSAKAIGSLFVGMGEEHEELRRLIPWLSATLSIETSPVERSGAAQGLAEICGSALHPDRVMQVLQTVLRLQQQSWCGREGLLWFLTFLPATLNEGFAVYISITLPVILSGLSDENEGVREVALRAGQVVVYKLGISHTNELIPALSQGMFEEDHRIRHSSVQLLGELLCMVGETKAAGMGGDDDEDEDGVYELGGGSLSRVLQKIRQHIGEEEASVVLASLYIVRADVSMVVRQAALGVWKSVVSNSPRTLMEIMPVLVRQLIDKLASPSETLRSVAGASLGEIVSKLGDKVLPAVVKPLREGLRSSVVSQRQGVCSGLNEIMAACTRKQAEDYLDVLVPALQQALCDPVRDVCSQAARAFLTLFRAVGVRAIHQIVPTLLDTYGNGEGADAQLALQGLREIVQQRPRDLLEYLLPTLMASPVSPTSAKALGSVMEVAGPQLFHYLSSLIPSLVQELSSTDAKIEQLKASADPDSVAAQLDIEMVRFEALKEAAAAVMGAVTTEGVHHLVGELGKQMEHDSKVHCRRWGCWLAAQFFAHSHASFTEYVPLMLKFLLSRVAESDRSLLQAVVDALQALSTAVPHGDFADHLEFMRTCISSTASAARHRVGPGQLLPNAAGELILPLFTIPKSLDPLYNILLHALMNGSHTAREVAADTIGELARFAEVAVLKPMLIKTTGPLIRVVGDRFPSSVKGAILQTLIVLLDKGGASLKAFVPQLQTTFVKALNDPARDVRSRGAAALGRLMPLSLRVDPLMTELTGLCVKAESTAIKISVLDAMATVLLMGGNKATPASLDAARGALTKALMEEDEGVRASASFAFARLVWFLESSAVTDAALDLLDTGKAGADWTQVCGKLQGLGAVLQGAGQQLQDVREEAYLAILAGCRDDRSTVNTAAASALSMMLSVPGGGTGKSRLESTCAVVVAVDARRAELRTAGQAGIHAFANALASLATAGASSDIKCRALLAIKQAAKFYFGAAAQHYKEFLPAVVACLKDIDLRVKYHAERALKHLCEGVTAAEAAAGTQRGQSAVLTTYLQNATSGGSSASAVEKDSAQTVRDYMRRVLPTLPADSDNEGYD